MSCTETPILFKREAVQIALDKRLIVFVFAGLTGKRNDENLLVFDVIILSPRLLKIIFNAFVCKSYKITFQLFTLHNSKFFDDFG